MKMRYVALYLIAANVVVFFVQSLIPGFTDAFLFLSSDVFSRPWILVTSIFLHGDFIHLGSNMIALGLFGLILERIIGDRKFIIFYFIAGIVANIVSLPFYNASLGASGAIFSILGILVVLRPRMIVFAMGVPMPMIIAAGFWLLLDITGVFFPSSIANIAHISGLIIGIVYGFIIRKHFLEARRQAHNILTKQELETWEDKHMR